MSNVLDSFYSEKTINTFNFNENPNTLIKEIEVSAENVKITYTKDDGSTILQFVNWTKPANATGLVSAGAFGVFISQWTDFGSLFLPVDQVKERCGLAAEKALAEINEAVKSIAAKENKEPVLLTNIEKALQAGQHQVLMETIVKGVLDLVKGQVYSTRGTLVLGYNKKGFLTPFKYGQSGTYKWPFFTEGTPVLAAPDEYFLHTKVAQPAQGAPVPPPVTEEAPW
jgi:hypothetical protein